MTTQPLSVLPDSVRDSLATVDEYITLMQADLRAGSVTTEGVSGDILAHINATRKCEPDQLTADECVTNLIRARGELRRA